MRLLHVAGSALGAAASLAQAASLPLLGLDRRVMNEHLAKRASNSSSCQFGQSAPEVSSPKTNVWAQISPADNLAVWDLLHAPESGLNLTDPDLAGINDNYVYWIDTLHTNKSDVLPYLDGNGTEPRKYARAIIFEGGKPDPVSQEYMIGPLPVGEDTTIAKADYYYNGGMGGSLPYNGRSFDGVKSAAMAELLISVMGNISDITTALFDGVWYGSADERSTMTASTTTPNSWDGTQGFGITMFRYPGPASYLTPLDLFVIIDCPGTDTTKFKLKGIVTNSRLFATVDDLRAAFDAGELHEEFQQTRDYAWALDNYHPDAGTRELEEKFAPQNLEIGGKRYKLDGEQQYVEYLGRSFYVAYTRTLGLMLYDIRFKGARILYELSMQEAAAQYGGFQPKAAATVYHDTYFDLGASISPLLEGYDCPYGSSFWNMTWHTGNRTTVSQNAICIFEQDIGHPLSRHRAGGGDNVYGFRNFGSTKGSALVVRSIATVGNYDYMFDYVFNVDASLEVVVRASGYLQSSFYFKDQGAWGPRIQQATQGSLHDHILTWKADFDIVDTENVLEVTELAAINTTQPWFPELGTFEQLTLHNYTLAQEQQWNWAPNGQAMYAVNSKGRTNKWGQSRGYRIVPRLSNIHLSTLQSPWSRSNMGYAKSHLAVTRQHDTEPYANSVQNLNMPWRPQQDFMRLFDGERHHIKATGNLCSGRQSLCINFFNKKVQ
jgi:primary-amine oxidase